MISALSTTASVYDMVTVHVKQFRKYPREI